jgi:zinc/manganese transport system permease protein
MSDAAHFLAPAFVMCLVIASIHVYLGMHVLERGVIFVDLALAQLAALGATVTGVLEEHHPDGAHAHFAAFAFTAVGAAIFTLAGRARSWMAQEAIVGIVYAVASSVTVLVLSRAPHGAEHMKEMLVGSLLLASWSDVGSIAIAYVLLGGVQLAFAKRFVQMSWRPDEGVSMPWDFGFYLLIGLVITLSVQVAGVLLVFSYLIVPAVITRFFSVRLLPRLFAGWGVALAASALGLGASWAWDLPTGAAVVASFGVLLGLAAPVRSLLMRGVP